MESNSLDMLSNCVFVLLTGMWILCLAEKDKDFLKIKNGTYPLINNKYKYVWGIWVLKYIHCLSHVRNGATTIYYIIYNLEKSHWINILLFSRTQ
jgi:hypothetical protein